MSATPPEPGRPAPGSRSTFELYREGRTTTEIRLTVHLVLAGRRWRSVLDERLRAIGQSSARMEALSAIINSPALSPQVDIAKRLRIEGPTMTRMLATLEADGLIERLPDPSDRRSKKLRVTPDGEATLQEMFVIADELRDRLWDGVPRERVEEVNEFLAQVLARLDAGLPERELEPVALSKTAG